MAKLTWDNVTGFNTEAGTESLKQAGSLFGKAFDNFSKTAEQKQNERVQANTAKALDELRSLNSLDQFDANQNNYSVDALDKRFGTGNYDPTEISKLRDTARQTIVDQDRANLKYNQEQKDREQRLKDEAFDRAVKQHNQENTRDNEIALDAANTAISQQDRLKNNAKLYPYVIKEWNKQHPDKKDLFKFDSLGKVYTDTPTEKINPEDLTEFTKLALFTGVSDKTTYNQMREEFITKLRNMKDTDGKPLLQPRYIQNALDQWDKNFVHPKLDPEVQKNQIDAVNAGIDTRTTQQLDDLKAQRDDILKTYKTPASPEERVQQTKDLDAYILETFPDDYSAWFTSDVAGNRLVGEIKKIESVGITLDDGSVIHPDKWMIYSALSSAGSFSDSLFGPDRQLNIDKFKKDIAKIATDAGAGQKDANGKPINFDERNTAIALRDAARLAYTAQFNLINSRAAAEKAQNEYRVRSTHQIYSAETNRRLLSGDLARAAARVQQGKNK